MNVPEAKLKEIMAGVFHTPAGEIGEASSMDTLQKWDSITHLKLVLALEDAFKISFSDQQTIEIISYPLVKIVLNEHGITFI